MWVLIVIYALLPMETDKTVSVYVVKSYEQCKIESDYILSHPPRNGKAIIQATCYLKGDING